MNSLAKFDLAILGWQQFELLAFRCLQEDISPSIKFFNGGNDKGRDILFNGITQFFGVSNTIGNYIFQVKHKSDSKSFRALKNDFHDEIEKVFLKHSLTCDHYCLVTNLQINANEFDELQRQFEKLKNTQVIGENIRLSIYDYSHFESTIDRCNHIKWSFPSVIKSTDFEYIIRNLFAAKGDALRKAWLKIFNRNRTKFIYTGIYEEANAKISNGNAMLLSGPPRTGKTFTAEMILLHRFVLYGFQPYKIDDINSFFDYYNEEKSQMFLFDDAFGRHDIELQRADGINRRLEDVFELLDENHKCIFTSREYIVRAFHEYSDIDIEEILSRVTVDTSTLSSEERESLLGRYFSLKFPGQDISYGKLGFLVDHVNFSPESVRSYFEDVDEFSPFTFLQHLGRPFKYLEKIFNNLSDERKIILLSILVALRPDLENIEYSFKNISKDYGWHSFVIVKREIYKLDESIIKIDTDSIRFFHPSMGDFFVGYLRELDSLYRNIIIENLNFELLSLLRFDLKSNVRRSSKYIYLDLTDISKIQKAFKRLIRNPNVLVSDVSSILIWLNSPDVVTGLKLEWNSRYAELRSGVIEDLASIETDKFANASIDDLVSFFKQITLYGDQILNADQIVKIILTHKKTDLDFWRVVFKMFPIVSKNLLFNKSYLGQKWFEEFYESTANEVESLISDLVSLQGRADLDWYPRYLKCKEQLKTIQAHHPLGYPRYERIIDRFQQLKSREDYHRDNFWEKRSTKRFRQN